MKKKNGVVVRIDEDCRKDMERFREEYFKNRLPFTTSSKYYAEHVQKLEEQVKKIQEKKGLL